MFRDGDGVVLEAASLELLLALPVAFAYGLPIAKFFSAFRRKKAGAWSLF